MNATVLTTAGVESVVWGCECYSRTTAGVESVVWGCESTPTVVLVWSQ